jgi:hypothetical protein
MARAIAIWIGASAVLACTIVDSVDGYGGNGVSSGATGGGDAALDTSGGTGGASGAAGGGCTIDPECDDANLCTDDACWAGGCINDPINPASIPDDNSCTEDSCDPETGIQHVMPSSPAPQVLQCGSIVCPSGYFVRKLTCIPECGACDPTFCVNGVLCERACEPEHTVCCGNDCEAVDCPPGYAMGATSSNGDCGCGPGNAMLCSRR